MGWRVKGEELGYAVVSVTSDNVVRWCVHGKEGRSGKMERVITCNVCCLLCNLLRKQKMPWQSRLSFLPQHFPVQMKLKLFRLMKISYYRTP